MSERNIESILPLTAMQEGILFHTLISPDTGMYFEQYSCKIQGNLNVGLFQTAWSQIVNRHPVLRSLVTWKNRKQPLQLVRRQLDIPWKIADWRELPAEEQSAQFEAFLKTDRQTGFDLSRPPLMRLALFQLDPRTYHFVWSFHHIMLDGWSMRLVLKEVFHIYEALLQETNPSLDQVQPFQLYIRWLQNQDLVKAENFWRETLKGFSSPTSLGLSAQQTHSQDRQKQFSEKELALSQALTNSLIQFARQHRITLNTLVQGAWALLLSRYSQETDVAFGVTVSGRPISIPGVEKMVGLFINTLPLRVQVGFEQQLTDWLNFIQSKMLDNQAYEFSPLVSIQKWSDVGAGTPLFNSILVFENHPAKLDQPDPEASLEISDARYIEYSNYPLALLVVPDEQLRLIAVYDHDWFDEETVSRLLSHLETIFTQMLLKQHAPLAEISILGEDEQDRLLNQWNNTAAPYPEEACIHHLIEQHARETPLSPAVVYEDKTLTYQELDQAANVLAKRLIDLGVQPETHVGIYLERSPEMIVAILGVLKAGGAYVPIDPSYPDERVIFLLQDTQCPVVVTERAISGQLPAYATEAYQGQLVMIDELSASDPEMASFDQPHVHSENLAYVIYTSGSTGNPKGVMVSHRNLVHSTTARINYYPIKTEAFLLLSSFAFDSSMVGIFGTLCQGGKLVLPRQRQEQDAAGLVRLIEKHQVTHLLTLPSLYLVLLDLFSPTQLKSLRTVIMAGEACPPDLAERHFNLLPGSRLYNEYGPTEASVWCTVYELTPELRDASVPIGKPIENAKIYILDQHGHLSPIGIAGELYVGGEGVARGYLNQAALTAERFVPDPFAEEGARIYKTGDLARWRRDGEIEFLGRVDQQIKIRGYRVELGEIETALLNHPEVREAVVIATHPVRAGSTEPTSSAKKLSAFLVLEQGAALTQQDLRSFMEKKLPEYMVPSGYGFLDELPLLPNGKIDRAAVLEIDVTETRVETGSQAAPQTETEKILAQIWGDLLGLDEIGIHDNFLEIGGDSLLSIRVIARANEAGLNLPAQLLFDYPTIAELASLIEKRSTTVKSQEAVYGEFPLLPIQQWFLEWDHPELNHWNQARMLQTPENMDETVLEKALQAMIAYHDALRIQVKYTEDGRAGFIPGSTEFSLEQYDLAGVSADHRVKEIERRADEIHRSLDLENGLVFRAAYFNFGPGAPGRLLLVVHHFVVDWVSWGILIDDLIRLYQNGLKGVENEKALPPKTCSIKAWAERLKEYSNSPRISEELNYWKSIAEQTEPHLPVDNEGGENSVASEQTIHFKLPVEATQNMLNEANQAYQTSVEELLLTAFVKTLSEWAGIPGLSIGLEGHGREDLFDDLELYRTVGWFTSYFPLFLSLDNPLDPGTSIKQIKEQVRQLPHRGIGYGILRYLSDFPQAQALKSDPYPQVIFNYLGRKETTTPGSRQFQLVDEPVGKERSMKGPRRYHFEINAYVEENQLHISWAYNENTHHKSTIESLSTDFITNLSQLIEHCLEPEAGGFTPSDFPLADLDNSELDKLSDLLDQFD